MTFIKPSESLGNVSAEMSICRFWNRALLSSSWGVRTSSSEEAEGLLLWRPCSVIETLFVDVIPWRKCPLLYFIASSVLFRHRSEQAQRQKRFQLEQMVLPQKLTRTRYQRSVVQQSFDWVRIQDFTFARTSLSNNLAIRQNIFFPHSSRFNFTAWTLSKTNPFNNVLNFSWANRAVWTEVRHTTFTCFRTQYLYTTCQNHVSQHPLNLLESWHRSGHCLRLKDMKTLGINRNTF